MNGNGHDTQAMQVNPIEAAQLALMFLARVDHKLAERVNLDKAAAMLQAIASGQVILSQPPAAQPTLAEAIVTQ